VPALQTALTHMNAMSHPGRIETIDPELFAPGTNLADAVGLLSQDEVPEQLVGVFAEYIQTLPPAISEACRAVIFSALNRSPRQPITFAWAPGYDYELQLWDVSDTDATPGGITLLLRSRYPNDAHPLA